MKKLSVKFILMVILAVFSITAVQRICAADFSSDQIIYLSEEPDDPNDSDEDVPE
ncbi:MAG: hypothetical protein K8R02_04795 [Anaerohalosphaeraceae bacterium]|nr:hypothetical protein [Anaerohalosphaeraceae bacterium]